VTRIPADKVVDKQPLASVVTKNGECDLAAPCAGEVAAVVRTKDRASVTLRQLVGG